MCFNEEEKGFIAQSGEGRARAFSDINAPVKFMRLKLNCEFKCNQGVLKKRRSVTVRLAPHIYTAIRFLFISWEKPLMQLGQQTYLEEQNNFEIVFKIMGTNACFFPLLWYALKWQNDLTQAFKEVERKKTNTFTSLLDPLQIQYWLVRACENGLLYWKSD